MVEAKPKLNLSMQEMDLVVQRCISEEYQFCVLANGDGREDPIYVSLEKGSTYGAMHMKFAAHGKTLLEAFNKCLANFPANPVGAVWDTKRIAAQPEEEVQDGEFTEVSASTSDWDVTRPPSPKANLDDDIPF